MAQSTDRCWKIWSKKFAPHMFNDLALWLHKRPTPNSVWYPPAVSINVLWERGGRSQLFSTLAYFFRPLQNPDLYREHVGIAGSPWPWDLAPCQNCNCGVYKHLFLLLSLFITSADNMLRHGKFQSGRRVTDMSLSLRSSHFSSIITPSKTVV